MTPAEFIDKWSRADRTERQAAQEHFIDLCRVLDEPTPNEAADPDGYSFEKGVSKIDGTGGFADVWKRVPFLLTACLVPTERRPLSVPPVSGWRGTP